MAKSITIQAPRGARYPLRMIATDPYTILINGERWFTRESYLAEMGLSPKSTQAPYLHVETGKAEAIDFAGGRLFRPIKKGANQ